MGKDNNKSNSDLIQRLKTLLAESEQRSGSQPIETDQEPVEEANRVILKNESDEPDHSLPDAADAEQETDQDISIIESEIPQIELPEEATQDIPEQSFSSPSTVDTEIRQSEPAEEIRETLNEYPVENPANENQLPESGPPEEAMPFEREERIQDLEPCQGEIDHNLPGEVIKEVNSTETKAEIRQSEPLEEARQEPERIAIGDPFKTKLREGVTMPQVGNYVVNYKNIVVKTSDGSVISGKTNIDAFSRLTEYLKQGTDRFITVFSEDAGDASKQVTIVNKDHIIWANTWD